MDAIGDVAILPDVDIDLDGFDFDLAADEFALCNGGGDKKLGVPALGFDSGAPGRGGSGTREASPDSAVTNVSMASGDGSMSDYVSELERFLMEDGDDDEVVGPDGERTTEDPAAYDYWVDLFADDNTVAATTDHCGDDPGAAAAVAAAAAAKKEDDDLDAPEDEATSRKRTRRQMSGMVTWGGLETRRRYLSQCNRVGCAVAAVPTAAAAAALRRSAQLISS